MIVLVVLVVLGIGCKRGENVLERGFADMALMWQSIGSIGDYHWECSYKNFYTSFSWKGLEKKMTLENIYEFEKTMIFQMSAF